MKRLTFSVSVVLIGLSYAAAQPLRIDKQVFAGRRAAFIAKMDSGSVAIFPCRPEYIRNGDVEYKYRQESNFYYLSGFEEPQSIILLNPSAPRYRYVLFVRKRDPAAEAWTGYRAGIEGARADYSADTALPFDDFEQHIRGLVHFGAEVYYPFGVNGDLDAIFHRLFSNDIWSIRNPYPILAEMRVIKNERDWRMGLTKAIDISVEGQVEALKAIKPGMYEYEVQAVFEDVYRRSGSPRNGYPCIVGSGPNSTTLHYDENTRMMDDGEMVLMDCAAEYGYYSADITRTVPVNGRFSKEQRDIYSLVLRAQKAAMDCVKPGAEFAAFSRAIDSVLAEGLLHLGLIKQKENFHLFSFHGYGHWIGLEVHDVGSYTAEGAPRKLEPGMVFTIEPGVYVRPEVLDKMKSLGYTDDDLARIRPLVEKYMNIGVRIEDDILVTSDGYRNLTAGVPREIDAIERLMKGKRSR